MIACILACSFCMGFAKQLQANAEFQSVDSTALPALASFLLATTGVRPSNLHQNRALSGINVMQSVPSQMSAEGLSKRDRLSMRARWRHTWDEARAIDDANNARAFDEARAIDDCNAGVDAACRALEAEEAAKRRWLASQDGFDLRQPQRVNEDFHNGMTDEEIAKQRWLATSKQPWGMNKNFNEEVAVEGMLGQDKVKSSWASTLSNKVVESTAGDDEAWRAQLFENEERAKRRWAAVLDAEVKQPFRVNKDLKKVAAEECTAGDDEACNALETEERANRRWAALLDAKLQQPFRTNKNFRKVVVEECMTGNDEACTALDAEERANLRWSEKLQGAKLKQPYSSRVMQAVVEECMAGDDEACKAIESRERANLRWATMLDAKLEQRWPGTNYEHRWPGTNHEQRWPGTNHEERAKSKEEMKPSWNAKLKDFRHPWHVSQLNADEAEKKRRLAKPARWRSLA